MVVAMRQLFPVLTPCSGNWSRGNRDLQPATVPNEAAEQSLAGYRHKIQRSPPTTGDLWTDPLSQ